MNSIGLRRKRITLGLFLLATFAELTNTKGLCKFTEMFLAETRKNSFKNESFQQRNDDFCPSNMILGNCTCVATCKYPTNEGDCSGNCIEGKGCVCLEGLLMKEEQCVPIEDCGCFVAELHQVIPNKGIYVNSECSRRCICRDEVLHCDDEYRCSPNAVCEERNNIRHCYCNHGFIGDGQSCTAVITDCYDILNNGFTESGIYTISPSWSESPFKVYCDMENNGGWTIFQRRVNGSVDFYRDWEDYKRGFGFLDHEFWLGNDKISNLTNQKNYLLRIDLTNSLGSSYYATYSSFRIAHEDDNYRLTRLGSYGGNAGRNSLSYHLGYAFTTRDRDNDNYPRNCAEIGYGAWWFRGCQQCNLNGGYFESQPSSMEWLGLQGNSYNIKYTEMKIRPFQN